MERIREALRQSADLKSAILADDLMLRAIADASSAVSDSLRAGGRVLFCGNGGSAADAQHLAAELSGRFYYDRPPLDGEALHVNTSYLTAVANDYSYDEIYARLVRARARKGDVVIGLSTSGNSGNIIRALEVAREIGAITIGFTGEGGGRMKDICDHLIAVPSKDTPRIQESHITIGHIICELVESSLFPRK